jgi:4-alpha-glucanotransferase
MIRACFGSVANIAIVPMQDILELDSWARFNTPGVGEGNWSWRYKQDVCMRPQRCMVVS